MQKPSQIGYANENKMEKSNVSETGSEYDARIDCSEKGIGRANETRIENNQMLCTVKYHIWSAAGFTAGTAHFSKLLATSEVLFCFSFISSWSPVSHF